MKEKAVKKFRDLEFWAEGPYVYIVHCKKAEKVDSKNAEEINKCFIGLEPEDFLKRATAVGAYVLRYWEDYKFAAKEVKQFLVDAQEVFRKAKEADPVKRKVQVLNPLGSSLWIPESAKPNIRPKKSESDPLIDIMVSGFELC